MTAYFILNEDGDRLRDKDGYNYIPFSEIPPWNFTDYAYKSRQAAEGEVQHFDPEGRAGLQVAERQINFEINNT